MKDKKIIIILLLVIIFIGILIAYFSSNSTSNNISNINDSMQKSSENNTQTLKATSEVKSASIEKIQPHTGYYLEEKYVEENQYVEQGANILKYTNGEYLVAPYDCYITELELPNTDEKCLNTHYVQIEGSNVLTVTMNIDEKQISKISVGTEVDVEVSAIENTYTGYVTHIASTASNGKFEVTIEFKNDGNTKLGMTASVKIEI